MWTPELIKREITQLDRISVLKNKRAKKLRKSSSKINMTIVMELQALNNWMKRWARRNKLDKDELESLFKKVASMLYIEQDPYPIVAIVINNFIKLNKHRSFDENTRRYKRKN